MRWFYELAWLWKGLGISLLAAAACMVCVWLVCRATGKRLRTGIAVLAAAAGFAVAVVVILLLAQTPTPILKKPPSPGNGNGSGNMPHGKQNGRPDNRTKHNKGGNI